MGARVEETANKFKLLDGDFLGYFKELGIPYNDVRPHPPAWC